MTSATAPFAPGVAELITGPHDVSATVTLTSPVLPDPLVLDVIGGRIGWDERRSPRVDGDLTCALPDGAAGMTALAALDPRTSTARVALTITYVLPSGELDAHVVADLHLRDREVNRPGGDVRIRCTSDEALAIDASPTGTYGYEGGDGTEPDTVTKANGPAWIAGVYADLIHPEVPAGVVITAPARPAEWPYGNPRDYWDSISDMADQLNIDVFDQGDRVLRIAPRTGVASNSVLALKSGPGGTVLRSRSGVSRDDFANFVIIRYVWTKPSTGEEMRVFGTARITAGPYNVTDNTYKSLVEERDSPTTQFAANLAAETILARMVSRSRSVNLTAVAAWWVRPGHTVTVDLPASDEARHLVSSVVFDLSEMTMDLATRLPDTLSVIGE